MTKAQTRRTMLVGLAVVAMPSTALAFEDVELDPADLVPRRFSVKKFLSLDEAEIHKVNLAVRRGRRIIIEGFSPSESRQIIREAREDLPAARQKLIRLSNSAS